MFRLYSKGCEYAIRALVCIVQKGDSLNFAAKDVCRKAGIPESFTRKVFQSLVKSKYLRAVPGNKGGYRLAKDLNQYSVLEIIKAVDGKGAFERCVLGSAAKCNAKRPCPLHSTWSQTKESLLRSLELKRLKDLGDEYKSGRRKNDR